MKNNIFGKAVAWALSRAGAVDATDGGVEEAVAKWLPKIAEDELEEIKQEYLAVQPINKKASAPKNSSCLLPLRLSIGELLLAYRRDRPDSKALLVDFAVENLGIARHKVEKKVRQFVKRCEVLAKDRDVLPLGVGKGYKRKGLSIKNALLRAEANLLKRRQARTRARAEACVVSVVR